MLVLGLLVLLRLPLASQVKTALVAGAIVVGLAGFLLKYAGFFEKGATSVSARFDYWQAAARTAYSNPALGTGPGTFAIPYLKLKRKESEMSRLVHNDYLEQASDSGFIGLVSYAAFIIGALTWSYRKIAPGLWTAATVAGPSERDESPDSGHGKRKRTPKASEQGSGIADITEKWLEADSWLSFAVWLGVLGWSLQCLLEFSLYIPALSWPAFAFLGWLLARTPEDAPLSRG